MKNVQLLAAVPVILSAVASFAADGYVDMIKAPPQQQKDGVTYIDWIDHAEYWEEGAKLDDPETNYRIAGSGSPGYILHGSGSSTKDTVLHGKSYTFGCLANGTTGGFSGRQANAVEFPNDGAFLEKGQFRQLSSGNRLEIRGKVTVASPKTSPYEVLSSHVVEDAKVDIGFRPSSFLFSAKVVCPKDNCLKLSWQANNDNSKIYASAGRFWAVTFSGDLSEFEGELSVATNVCLGVCDTSLPGGVTLNRHSQLAVSNATATAAIGSLTFVGDNSLVFKTDAANGRIGQIKVTKALTLPTDKVRLVFDSLYKLGPATYPLVTIGKDVATSVAKENFELTEKGAYELSAGELVEGTDTDGNKVFSVKYGKRFVTLLKNDPSNINIDYDTYSAFTNASSWSDSDWPTNKDAIYSTDAHFLRMPYDPKGTFTFAGHALFVDSTFFIRQLTNTFENLYLSGTGNAMLFNFYSFSSYLYGNLTVESRGGTLKSYAGFAQTNKVDKLLNGFRVHSALHGGGQLKITGNDGSVNMPTDIVIYRNAESDFSGSFLVTLLSAPARSYPSLEKGYVTFCAEDASVLGVDLPAFKFDALQLEQMCRFRPLTTTTLAKASNRGIFIKGCGRIFTPEGVTFTVGPTVTYDGLFRKEGAGELILESAADVQSVTSAVEVVEGAVRARHADAFGAMPVTLDAGTTLVFDADPSDADMKTKGIDRSAAETPFTVGGGTLNVAIDGSADTLRSGEHAVALFTVKATDAAALAAKVVVAKPCKGVRCRVETAPVAGTDKTLVSAIVEPTGMVLIFR